MLAYEVRLAPDGSNLEWIERTASGEKHYDTEPEIELVHAHGRRTAVDPSHRLAAVDGAIASRASEGAEPMSRLLLSLLTCCVAIAATAAPLSPAARAEIDGLLVRLVASGCEFNRNGSWYTAAEAKSHLSQKLKYLEDRGMVQTTEQFIEMAASGSSMSGQPYLVRCGNSAPVQSGQWLRSELKDLRSVTGAKSTP